MPIDALDVSYAQLTRDLFAIAKFLLDKVTTYMDSGKDVDAPVSLPNSPLARARPWTVSWHALKTVPAYG